jgi:hypothetical protein
MRLIIHGELNIMMALQISPRWWQNQRRGCPLPGWRRRI